MIEIINDTIKGMNTKVLVNGKAIIWSKLEIHIAPDEIVTATITVPVDTLQVKVGENNVVIVEEKPAPIKKPAAASILCDKCRHHRGEHAARIQTMGSLVCYVDGCTCQDFRAPQQTTKEPKK